MTAKTTKKPIVLILCNYYLPGYKSGGGLRSLVHMVERFNDKFDFRVITLDHDGDGIPYTTVKINDWNETPDSKIYYLSKNSVKLSKLRELIYEVNPQVIYINSVFSILSVFLLTLKRLKLTGGTPIILAPEGELSAGALQLKAQKKKFFIKFARITGLYRNLTWKVTAEPEKVETERFKGGGGEIFIAPNIPSKLIYEEYKQESKPTKKDGAAKMIFLSRYMRKKNLKWLLENLRDIRGKLEIDIVGPIEDKDYWTETENVIKNLPDSIKVNYQGFIEPQDVLEKMFEYHFFVLPTLGENFGHVFVEALAAGCPLLISDRTPWVNLEAKQIGWDLPLENERIWSEKINQCIGLDNDSYTKLSINARDFALKWLNDKSIEEDTLRVLEFGLTKSLTKTA